MAGRRAVWAGLRFAHPSVDPTNPSDDFAQAVIAAAGHDPDVWVVGTESEALTAYRVALAAVMPDHGWADDLIGRDPSIATDVSVCVDMGIPYSTFLAWDEADQDLAIATVLRRRDTCPAGRHPREAMSDPDAVVLSRVHCAACANEHDIEERFRDAPDDMRIGWSVEVTRVPR